MAIQVLMPKLGLTMTEGTVDSWYKKEGDPVEKGEVVCTISSEKLTHDVEAPDNGVLLKILVQETEEQACKEPIGILGVAGEQVSSPSISTEKPKEILVAPPNVAEKPAQLASSLPTARIFITPLARKIAAEKGIDYTQVVGTGGNGRITRRDIESFVPVKVALPTEAAAKSVTQAGEGLSGMRKVIAQRMHYSLQQSAQVTLHQKVNVTPLMAFRQELKAKLGDDAKAALNVNVLLMRAVVLALRDHPEMNASYSNGKHEVHEDIHVGMAVAVEGGLIVPVIRQANAKTLTQLAEGLATVTTGVKENTLSSDLLTGSTFTISNLGSTGVEYFTPILNTPEVGILGVGALTSKLVFNAEKEVVEQQELPLSLTFDHQVIDGAPAAVFLQSISKYLENPYSLML
ncbi:MAG: dihydrolipoamide acetyltransferase family protein [Solibacillus sp.]